MYTVLLTLFLLGTVHSQITKIFSVERDGTEVVNINTAGITLAYGANIQIDPNANDDQQTLYFTADKGTPNVYSANFLLSGGSQPQSFWVNAGPVIPNTTAPFFSFDAENNNFFGPAYPLEPQIPDAAAFALQLVTVDPNTKQVGVYQHHIPGFAWISTYIDPYPDHIQNQTNPGYIVGWSSFSPFPLRLFKAYLTLNNPSAPKIELSVGSESLALSMDRPCYDLFTETMRPQITITTDSKNVIVIVPGRCGLFAKIPIVPGVPLSQLQNNISVFYPGQFYNPNTNYVSSVVYDQYNDYIFYTVKTYNTPGGFIHSFNAQTWKLNAAFAPIDVAESEAILVLGNEVDTPTSTKYLFVISSGSNKIQRFNVDGNNTISGRALAVLPPDLNRISSAFYYYPFIYYVTYEPDAKVVRISKTSFCNSWCGDNGYCNQGLCYCQTGYDPDPTDPDVPCKLQEIISAETQERQSQGAAAALGVLFAFSLVAAFAGWFLWWKAKKHIDNRPLVAT
jgi:hypothetical protein